MKKARAAMVEEFVRKHGVTLCPPDDGWRLRLYEQRLRRRWSLNRGPAGGRQGWFRRGEGCI